MRSAALQKAAFLAALLALAALFALCVARFVEAQPRPQPFAARGPQPFTRPLPGNPDGIPVNTADAQTLDTLPGVGPATAQAIIEERERAPFFFAEDLLAVRGIGEKKLEALLGLVSVE